MTVQTPEQAPEQNAKQGTEQATEQGFTQADVDKAIAKRLAAERAKLAERYADYDELKSKADGAKTADQRIADLEQKLKAADAREQRRGLVERIAREHKITDPDDITLFLTGADEDTLQAQAKRLAARDAQAKKAGDVVPREGTTPKNGQPNDQAAFARKLFGGNPD